MGCDNAGSFVISRHIGGNPPHLMVVALFFHLIKTIKLS